MRDVLDSYGFRFLENIENPIVELNSIGRESRFNKTYYFDNRNRHRSYLFQYTLGGSGTIKSGGKVYVLEKGDAFFMNMPGEDIYYFDEENNQAPWEFIYIMFSGENLVQYFQYITERFSMVMNLSEYHPAIRKLWDIYRKAQNGQLTDAFVAGNEVFSFVSLLCAKEDRAEDAHIPLIENAKRYLEVNYYKEISLLSVAEYLGVTQSHLSREFAKNVGESPIKYLTKLRLEKAAELLFTTEMSVEMIGKACGYEDVNYFCKVFRRYMKMSPGEFRKQAKVQGYRRIQV